MHSTNCPYKFFGDLFLPNPENILSPAALKRLRQIEPYLRELEERRFAPHNLEAWNYKDAFSNAVQTEVASWERLGVKRVPDFALPPQGPLNARVACHLHCPSFSVRDPYCSETGDPSNISICQIMLAGFTTTQCLIYDHLFRREALDGFRYYPPHILQVHERFLSSLRQHMGAIVDICWGNCVRDRVLKTHNLEPLELWGDFEEVELWLEWETPQEVSPPRLARFVVFVMHPEAMIYATRATHGKIQDKHLSAAARLGRINIDEHFYETSHRPGTYGRLCKVEWARQKAHNHEATAQVFSAAGVCTRFGEYASTVTSPKPEVRPPTVFPGLESCLTLEGAAKERGKRNSMPDFSKDAEQAIEEMTYRIDPAISDTVHAPQGFKCLVSALTSRDFAIDDVLSLLSFSASHELDAFGGRSWESIPCPLRTWLESQEGLKIDRRPINCITDVLRAYRLLCRKPSSLRNAHDIGIIGMVIQIAIRYYKQIYRVNPVETIRVASLTVAGQGPMPRKCAHCKSRVLDDAFPRFKRLEPSRYVARFLKGGCGGEGCDPPGDCVWAVPVDDDINWTKPDATDLSRPPKKAAWSDILLHNKGSLAGLQGSDRAVLERSVDCVCRKCRSLDSVTRDTTPRWTIETSPRYVPRKPRCTVCKSRAVTWQPCDSSIKFLDAAALSKLWIKFTKKEWSVGELFQNPDIFFPTKAERSMSE